MHEGRERKILGGGKRRKESEGREGRGRKEEGGRVL